MKEKNFDLLVKKKIRQKGENHSSFSSKQPVHRAQGTSIEWRKKTYIPGGERVILAEKGKPLRLLRKDRT